MPPRTKDDIRVMHPSSCIGLSGDVVSGLHAVAYEGEKFIAYPLGAMVVVKRERSREGVAFLQGHSRSVSCVAVSHDGKLAASGQTNQLGVEAPVMLWDLEEACERVLRTGGAGEVAQGPRFVLRQHLAGVQAMAFSCDDRSLATLGGRDDNSLVIWDTRTGHAVCGVPAAPDTVLCVCWLNDNPFRLVTAGKYHVRVWHVDPSGPKIHPMEAKMGKMRRVVQCVAISSDDNYALCGTQTGEILQIDVNRDPIQAYNDPDRQVPRLISVSKDRFGKGVKALTVLPGASKDGLDIVACGAGDGTLAFFTVDVRRFKRWTASIAGGVTSLSAVPGAAEPSIAIGSDLCNRYELVLGREPALKGTAHTGPVFDVCFPEYSSQVFITCSVADIRVWDTAKRAEILRIQVPNLECKCVGVTAVGDVVVTGWTDGKVRAFGPESGKLKFAIPDAHAEAVTALALCKEGGCVAARSGAPWRLLSGGLDGRVRVWNITPSHQALVISMKEHRSQVTCIRITGDRDQCISSSKDGACLIWCLERYVRLTALFEPTLFNSVLYHPDASQILTCGSNTKISYWEASSGDAIRVVNGGDGEMTALAISKNGKYFVSGSADKSVKLWDYDGGIFIASGVAHSGTVSAATISPDQKTVVSVGHEGGVFIWPLPGDVAADM